VQKYFYRRRDIGLLRTINNELVMAARERKAERQAPPPVLSTAGQSRLAKAVKSAALMRARK
jgi:hypothetical protein